MTTAARPVRLLAAGSLRAAAGAVVDRFTREYGVAVECVFGAAGLLRERIEAGERADLFASANRAHPLALAGQGVGGPVVTFASNSLCVLARPGLRLAPESLVDGLLDEDVRVGTSTPGADPSGDYAVELFRHVEMLRPGSRRRLEEKSLRLTGAPDCDDPPPGRNRYAWVLTDARADVFLTYHTNALAARADSPELQIVTIPESCAVRAEYGLSLLNPSHPGAARLALFILAPEGRGVLRDHGFGT